MLEAQGSSATNIKAAEKLKDKKTGGLATRYACNMIVNASQFAPLGIVQKEIAEKIRDEMAERKKKHPEYTADDLLADYRNSNDFKWMIQKLNLSFQLFEGIAQEVCK